MFGSRFPAQGASKVLVRTKVVELAAFGWSGIYGEAILLQSRRICQLDDKLYTIHQYVDIARGLQVVWVHQRVVKRIGTFQFKVTSALRHSESRASQEKPLSTILEISRVFAFFWCTRFRTRRPVPIEECLNE